MTTDAFEHVIYLAYKQRFSSDFVSSYVLSDSGLIDRDLEDGDSPVYVMEQDIEEASPLPFITQDIHRRTYG